MEKRVAIYYFKGLGQSALTASGMEVIPSLYNLLKELKKQGYNVSGLPETLEGFRSDIMRQGCVLGTYAKGAFDDYLKNGNPQLVSKEEYEEWIHKTLTPESYAEVVRQYGEAPGEYMGIDGKYIAVARVQYGNVVLMPQPMAATGEDAFALVAILGIVVTMNGQTVVEGLATVDWMTLFSCLGLVVLGGGLSLLFKYLKMKKILGSNYK